MLANPYVNPNSGYLWVVWGTPLGVPWVKMLGKSDPMTPKYYPKWWSTMVQSVELSPQTNPKQKHPEVILIRPKHPCWKRCRCNSWIKNNLVKVPENSCQFCCFLRSLVLGKVFKFLVGGFLFIHPWRLTWRFGRSFSFLNEWRFHVNLVGGRFTPSLSNANLYCLHWCENCILGPFLAAFCPLHWTWSDMLVDAVPFQKYSWWKKSCSSWDIYI